jgi:hypothetical protein
MTEPTQAGDVWTELEICFATQSQVEIHSSVYRALTRGRALEKVVEAARATETIYWDFEKSMKKEVEALRDALAELDRVGKGPQPASK